MVESSVLVVNYLVQHLKQFDHDVQLDSSAKLDSLVFKSTFTTKTVLQVKITSEETKKIGVLEEELQQDIHHCWCDCV